MTSKGTWVGALVDSAVVVAATLLVLTLLDESFWSRDYLVAGMVPVVFLLALAWSVRHLADGVWIYSLGSLSPTHRWARSQPCTVPARGLCRPSTR